jgi:hypothetical protein
MWNDSQHFIIFPLLHVFNNCIVYSKFPCLCLFLRMCNVYSEIGLFVLIHLVCSLCLISIDCQSGQRDLLHVLYCTLYIPLEFILFCGVLSHNWLYIHIVLHIQNAMFKSVLVGNFYVSELWYVIVIHFFLCVCVNVFSVFCVLSISLFSKLWMICNQKPLFLAMVQIVFHSCCLACSVIGVSSILFV